MTKWRDRLCLMILCDCVWSPARNGKHLKFSKGTTDANKGQKVEYPGSLGELDMVGVV